MTAGLKTRCPHCQRTIPAEEGQLLTKVVCPQCRQSFTVQSVRPHVAGNDTDPVLQDTLAAKPAAPTPKPSLKTEAGRGNPQATTSTGGTKSAAAASEPTKETLGRFQLKKMLGAGGFAVVWRAYDPLLERFVALKLPKFGAEEEHQVRRFLNEAKTAARLRHPNIVAVYESGQVGHRLFLASELVVGQPLNKRIATARPDLPTAVAWVRDLAEALDYAHKEGVVHRDIKPHNILVDEKGRPQITDFGLAREINRDSTLTTEGTVLGTPAYMSPEQARADLPAIGPASDQYSLGVVLYELLTGKRPFDGDPQLVILKVLKEEPLAPRKLAPQLPRDLEAICLKAMDKEAKRRYPTASHFAADLAHWLAGEPVAARHARPWERLARWARRNPAISGLSAGILAIALAAFVAVSAALVVVAGARSTAVEERNAAQQARDLADSRARDLQAERDKLRDTLAQLKTQTTRADTKSAEAAKLDRQLQTKLAEVGAAQKEVDRLFAESKQAQAESELARKQAMEAEKSAKVALENVAGETRRAQRLLGQSYLDLGLRKCEEGNIAEGSLWLARSLETLPPDAEDLAVTIRSNLGRYLELVDDAGRALAPRLRLALVHEHPLTAVAYRPAGDRVISGDAAGNVYIWDVATGEKVISEQAHEGAVRAVACDPAGSDLVATCGDDKQLRLWRLTAAGQLEAVRKAPCDWPPTSLAWSGDGSWLLVASNTTRQLQVFSAATGRAAGQPFGKEQISGQVTSAAYCPPVKDRGNGPVALVGTGGLEHTVRLWDTSRRAPLGQALNVQSDALAIALHGGGERAAVGTKDGKVWLVDLAKGSIPSQPLVHQGPVLAAASSPDQRTLLTGCQDRTAQLWDWETGLARADPLPHEGAVTAVAFAPGGGEFCTASEDKSVRLWSIPVPRKVRTIAEGGRIIDALALSPDGYRLVTASERDVDVRHTLSGERIGTIRDKVDAIYALAFTPGGRTFLVGDARCGRLWDATTLKPLGIEMKHEGRVLAVAVSGDGQRLATGSFDRTARVWLAGTQMAACTGLVHPAAVTAVALSADGKRLVTGCEDHRARLWSVDQPAEPLFVLETSGIVHSVAISDDGRYLAAGGDSGAAIVWEAQTGQAVGAPLVHSGSVRQVRFVPRQSILATGSRDGVQLWNVADGRKIGQATEMPGEARFLGISQDGATFAAAAGEPQVTQALVWQVPPAMRAASAWISTWVKLRAGRQLTDSGAAVALSPQETAALRTRLAELEAAEGR